MYKTTLKDEIDSWLKNLNAHGVADFLILVVETLDVKKTKNILPRSTVLDKIRSDFASKNEDRCISVLNPMKFEMKATESFRCLLQRIRFLMLSGYNRNITKYEELIRANRERRNQEKWNFINYFLLQEQLAFIFEMLGLHSEALVQYDELDAMFSQFVLNSVIGDKPSWIDVFGRQYQSFQGINLDKRVMFETRKLIIGQSVSLLQFRSYLFGRQCILLNNSSRPWEIAERLLPFLFSTLREMDVLKLEMAQGALACWEFVCALEVLKVCDEAAETDESNQCFQHCAEIWNLAKDKLYDLGKLCGLLPGCTPSSAQLHIVVQLSAGIGDTITSEDLTELEAKQYSLKAAAGGESSSRSRSPSATRIKKPPTERLKEALGSNHAFQKLYMELSELAISTYKHVSRLRSARLVGLDLGNFYCTLNEPQKAVVFFTDLLRELKAENWNFLASQSLLELASCYQKMNDLLSYTKTSCAIACCVELEILVRCFYFDEFLKSMKELKAREDVSNACVLEDHFQIMTMKILTDLPIVQDRTIELEVMLESKFPREVVVNKIAMAFEQFQTSKTLVDIGNDAITNPFAMGTKQPMTLQLAYKQDNSLESASVVCEQKGKPVRRSSSTRRKISPTLRHDFTNCVSIQNVSLQPGRNVVILSSKATRVGTWMFKQLSVQFDNMDFLSDGLPNKQKPFEVITKPASASLCFEHVLFAGIEQKLTLKVAAGSFVFPKEALIILKGSKSLKFKLLDDKESDFQKELNITLIDMTTFEERDITIETICDLPGRREDRPIEHSVDMTVPWSRSPIVVPLNFSPSITATCRLHTSGIKKFLQVIVKGVLDSELMLSDAEMKCSANGIELQNLNPKSQNEISIKKDLTISYLWEIQIEPLKTENELTVIQVNYNVQYALQQRPNVKRNYSCTFDVTDYATLFKIQAKVSIGFKLRNLIL